MAAKPFREALKDLAQAHDKSVARVMHDAASHDVKGLAPDTLKKAVSGERPIRAFQIAAIVRAAGVEPEQVPHYRMARLREQLDERLGDPDVALKTLDDIEARQPDFTLVDNTGTPVAWIECKRFAGSLGVPRVAHVAAEMLAEMARLLEGGDLTMQVAAGAAMPTQSGAEAELQRLLREEAERTRGPGTTSPEERPGEDSRETQR